MEADRIMKSATFALVILVGALGLAPANSFADMPGGKIAVVRVTAIDGLAHHTPEKETRSSAFTFDGTNYSVDRSALSSLDGVETLVLIDRKTDDLQGASVVRHYTQEVRAFSGGSFEVTDLQGKVLHYQVAMIGGNLRLLGDGDQILAKAGAGGPFQIWKITDIDLVDRKAVVLR
jgi:hypothetical protein